MRKITQQNAINYYSTDQLTLIGKYINCSTLTEYVCKCGNILYIKPGDVQRKHKKSCGCYKRTKKPRLSQEEAKKKYSSPTLILTGQYINCDHPTEYKCICGNVKNISPYLVWKQHTKSCGCLNSTQVSIRSRTKNKTILTDNQQQILDGLIISDGSIAIVKNAINAQFILVNTTKSLIDKIILELPFIWSPVYIKPAKYYDDALQKQIFHREKYYLTSHKDIELTKEYRRWYKWNERLQKILKIVPKDLEISPLMLKYWFYGDGTTIRDKTQQNIVSLKLCTDGFTLEECEYLQNKLSNINISLNIRKNSRPNTSSNYNRGYELVSKKISVIQNFFDYIGECDVEGFQYKWKIPYFKRKN